MFVRCALIVALLSSFVMAEEKPPAPPASKPASTPVDFRKLKEIMPEKIAEQPRKSNEGEKISAGEMVFTHGAGVLPPEARHEVEIRAEARRHAKGA